MYQLRAAGTMAIHAVAIVDSVLLYVTVGYIVICDGNVVVLRGSTWWYMEEV